MGFAQTNTQNSHVFHDASDAFPNGRLYKKGTLFVQLHPIEVSTCLYSS